MLTSDLMWWITAIEIPVLTGLFWIVFYNARHSDQRYDTLHKLLDARHSQLRESLAAYKLEVAKSYAAYSMLKDLEDRFGAQLERIESKLDRTALKAEALRATRLGEDD